MIVAAREPLRVVVADDHPAYRAALARALRENGIDVVAEASNGEAAIRAALETEPDVVVMDPSEFAPPRPAIQ